MLTSFITQNKKILSIIFALLILLVTSVIFWFRFPEPTITPTPVPVSDPLPTTEPIAEETASPRKVVGTSVEGREIETYTYGTGEKTVLMVGGIHGGYEWNSSLLAYEFITALEKKSLLVPEELRIIIIPTLNPDGLYKATGLVGVFTKNDISNNDMHAAGIGRFNANDVDLNRNFACKWAPKSSWRSKEVSAGTAPFSEPEAVALRNVVGETEPVVVVFWHSQANAVYASECETGVLPETLTFMNLYAAAARYTPVPVFDAYPITGDAEGWLASINIPAITVELESRTDIEWERNRAGVEAILKHLSTQ